MTQQEKTSNPAPVAQVRGSEPTIYVSRKSLDELLSAEGSHVALQTLIHRKPLRSGNGVPLYEHPPAPQDHLEGINAEDWHLANLHAVIETAANAADAAVYESMRSEAFDPTIPDNVAEFVGNAVRAALALEVK